MSIAVVVPTIREECFEEFEVAWDKLFTKHDVTLIKVADGDSPKLECWKSRGSEVTELWLEDVLELKDLVFNKNDGVRNFGFWFTAGYLPEAEYIITLDDDTKPIGDTIQDHIDALNKRVPISWLSTASEFMRGFPYSVREEAEVVLSHGVWDGVKDWDAPTQLVLGNKSCEFYRGSIPKGIYYPMCGMNIAFKRKMLPYMYFAPMGHKVNMDRFADIWCGIESKRIVDANEWAVVTGYAKVRHDRASNVWKNLQKEARGIEANEKVWYSDFSENEEYFKLYTEKRKQWEVLINK